MQHNVIQACISCPERWCWNNDAGRGKARCSKQCYFGLEKQLLSHEVKCLIYRTLIRPVLTCGSETWAMGKHGENLLWSLDRKVLQKIFGLVHENGHWRRHKISEIYTLNDEHGVGKFIKFGRLRWVRYVMRIIRKWPCEQSFATNQDEMEIEGEEDRS